MRIRKKKGPKDKSRTVETLKKSLQRARKMAAKMEIDATGTRLDDLRIHDLRRTLGHKSVASTQIYSRFNIDPVGDSMQTATQTMFTAGGLLPKADVTPITKAKREKPP